MPVIPTAEQIGPTTVRYTWAGDAPFRVWLRGELLIDRQDVTTAVVEYYDEDAEPWIEVLDTNDTDPAQSDAHSPRLRLQWRGNSDAAFYEIQRWNGDEFTTRAVQVESGHGYYSYLTPPEQDGFTARWRIVAEDDRGNTGDAEFSVIQQVICNPATPAVTATYDADNGEIVLDG